MPDQRAMPDQDWRLRVRFADEAHGLHLSERLHAAELAHEARAKFGERVVVSRDGPELFLYANSEGAAKEAEGVVRSELEGEGRDADIALDRWHPVEEEWLDAAQPLPDDPAAERAVLMAEESEEARERGYAEFEVRIDLPSWGEATELSKRLDEEGLAHVRRWRYIVLGAANEDAANELAERMRGQLAPDAQVSVEGSFAAAQAEQPYKPFAIFGM
jgi:hypothetical protein